MGLGRRTVLAAAGITALLGSAHADSDFSGYITAVSEYRFRGISNSDRHPALQGSINWQNENGFYVGAWASSIDFNDPGSTAVELDLYAGKHIDIGGSDLNLEAYYYAYPDKDNALPEYNFFEAIVGFSHSWDAFTLGTTVNWSPQFQGHTGNGWYVAGNASYALNDWVTFSSNVGHQWVDKIGTNYTHWDLGATFTYRQFAVDVRYVDTDVSVAGCGGTNWCKGTVVGAVTWNIGG
jgi:uncharacterized protein (TIGR02001 family)